MRGRRIWRWAVGAWAVLVLSGGGVTLWLDDTDRVAPGADDPAQHPAEWERELRKECPDSVDGDPAAPVTLCAVARE